MKHAKANRAELLLSSRTTKTNQESSFAWHIPLGSPMSCHARVVPFSSDVGIFSLYVSYIAKEKIISGQYLLAVGIASVSGSCRNLVDQGHEYFHVCPRQRSIISIDEFQPPSSHPTQPFRKLGDRQRGCMSITWSRCGNRNPGLITALHSTLLCHHKSRVGVPALATL